MLRIDVLGLVLVIGLSFTSCQNQEHLIGKNQFKDAILIGTHEEGIYITPFAITILEDSKIMAQITAQYITLLDGTLHFEDFEARKVIKSTKITIKRDSILFIEDGKPLESSILR